MHNLIPLLALIPQGAGRAGWQGVGGNHKDKGCPGFREAGRVVTPTPGSPKKGEAEMAFRVLRRRERGWRSQPGAGDRVRAGRSEGGGREK